MKRKIFISPGHNELTWEMFHSKGIQASDGLFQEFNDFNIKVADLLVILLKQHSEFEIHQLEFNNNQVDMELWERIQYINKICSMEDIIISIHGNYSKDKKVNGAWGLYNGRRSKILIDLYIKHSKDNLIQYKKTWECKDDGSWLDLGIVMKTKCPVILLEAGFFSNDNDRKILKNKEYHKQVANSLYLMVCEYYNILPIINNNENNTNDWKIKAIEKGLEIGYITEKEWLKKVDENISTAYMCEILNKMYVLLNR